MKIQEIYKENIKEKRNLSFEGVRNAYSSKGDLVYRFFAPPYDSNTYKATLEIVGLSNRDGQWHVDGTSNAIRIETDELDNILKEGGTFDYTHSQGKGRLGHIGYRFVLKDRGNVHDAEKYVYLTDAGIKDSSNRFSVVHKNMGVISKGGPMYHVFLDSYFNPGWKNRGEDMASKFIRNHFGRAGGNIFGIIKKLKEENSPLEPYRLVMSSPSTGLSHQAHGYHTKNPFQTEDIDAFKALQVELFNQGKGYVNDGAYTFQAIDGFQVKDVLLNGEASPFYHWIKAGEKRISLGILPDKTTTDNTKLQDPFDYISYKLVNARGSRKYDESKPTYLQFYDKRLISAEQQKYQVEDPSAFVVVNTDSSGKDIYAVKDYNDSVHTYHIPLSARVDDEGYIEELGKYQGKTLNELIKENVSLNDLFTFRHFTVTTRKNTTGINNWDGAAEIIKMNLSIPEGNNASLAGYAQARNSLYATATYWTKLTSNALLEDVARKAAKGDGELKKIAEKFGLNKAEFDKALEAAKNSEYKTKLVKKIDENFSENDFLLDEIVNFPLESIGFDDDLSALLSSPYITPRPHLLGDENLSRREYMSTHIKKDRKDDYTGYASKVLYSLKDATQAGEDYRDKANEIFKINSEMCNLYTGKLQAAVVNILKKIQPKGPEADKYAQIYDSTGHLTEYGQYVARIFVPEIVKFIFVSGLFPDPKPEFDPETGNIKYGNLREKGLYALDNRKGNDANTRSGNPDKQASELIGEIRKALEGFELEGKTEQDKIKVDAKLEPLLASIRAKIEGTNLESFKVAEAVLEQTGGGLNWRFDAAKDIADLDRRRKNGDYEYFDENGNFKGWGRLTFESCWKDVIEIWGNFIGNARKENNSSYVIAEITDLHSFEGEVGPDAVGLGNNPYLNLPDTKNLLKDMLKNNNYEAAKEVYYDSKGRPKAERQPYIDQDFGIYKNEGLAERMFLEQTGATANSNYTHAFGLLPMAVGQNPEDAKNVPDAVKRIKDFASAISGMSSGAHTSIVNSHVFWGNHDKPRVLFSMSLNMHLYRTDFTKDDIDGRHKDTAEKLTGLTRGTEEFKNLSSEAVAVGEAFNRAFEKTLKLEFRDGKAEGSSHGDGDIQGIAASLYNEAILPALRNLILGKSQKFGWSNQDIARARAWGSKDFEISLRNVFEEAEAIAGKSIIEKAHLISAMQQDKIKKLIITDTRNKVLEYADQRMYKMAELMQMVPGVATLYAGDELGMTGHETKNKNSKQCNREIVPLYKMFRDKTDPDRQRYETMKAIFSLPSLEGMSALAGGSPIDMSQDAGGNSDVYAMYFYDDKGSEVIGAYCSANVNVDNPFEPLVHENAPEKWVSHIKLSDNALMYSGFNTDIKDGDDEFVFKRKVFDKNTKQYIDKIDDNTGVEEKFKIMLGDKGYYLKKFGVDGNGYITYYDFKLDPIANFFYRDRKKVRERFYFNGYNFHATNKPPKAAS